MNMENNMLASALRLVRKYGYASKWCLSFREIGACIKAGWIEVRRDSLAAYVPPQDTKRGS